jgi:MFS family permease
LTDAAATGPVQPLSRPLYSDGYKHTVLGLLVLAYTFNFIDRTIVATIGQAIKVDLKLTDTQLGLLGGLAFAILYTTLGIPIARLAERTSRVNIIAIAIVVWSAFTALCGAAQNFLHLLLLRVGVGVGEAGLSPPAHSLISDYFEPKRRATALSIYAFGIPAGSMFGAIAGGWIAQNLDWRWAFVIVGLPGVIVAAIIKAVIKEPARGHSDREANPDAPPAAKPAPLSLAEEFRELFAVARTLFGHWPVLHFLLGVTIASFTGYGAGAFAAPYFIRQFGLDLATVGLVTGLIGGISSGLGTLAGGFLTDFAGKRSVAWYAYVPGLGLLIATPIYMIAYTQNSWILANAILLIPGIFHYTYLGPTFGVVQNVVETRRRATAAALLLFFLNLIALGGGPPFTGWLIDQFAQFHFVNGLGPGAVETLFSAFGPGAHGESYVAACPGGVAPEGASEALAARCHDAGALATRQGILVVFIGYAWAGVHYLLGSIGLAKLWAARQTQFAAAG